MTKYPNIVGELVRTLSLWPLWAFIGWNDIRQRYRRSWLGPIWLTVSLAVMVFSIGTLYSQIMRVDVDAYLPFFCVSILSWTFIATTINETCMAYTGSEALIKQIALPFPLHILRVVWRNFIIFLHHIVIFFIVAIIFRINMLPTIAALLPGLALVIVNLVWIGLLGAALSARFRDLPQIVINILQVMIFFTPILWQPSILSGNMLLVVYLNPFFHLVELIRAPLLGHPTPGQTWIAGVLMAVVGFGLTQLFYRRFRSRIAYWL